MQEFKEKLLAHVEHIKTVGPHCSTEETTKQALILPFLNILDFSPFDPQKVKAEYGANLPGVKANERVDYALFSDGNPVMFVEAKSFNEKLTNHAGQLARYFNSTPGVSVAAITNGREWRFFTDLKLPNVMDESPFLKVNFDALSESDMEQLAQFRYGCFRPDQLRTFAEERVYQEQFQEVIESCLRDVDQEFVRFVANRAKLVAKLTPRVLDTITPLIKRAVADAISKMVVTGLSAPPVPFNTAPELAPVPEDSQESVADPSNPRIITTAAELKLLSILKDMLNGVVNTDEVVGKDTESYYTVLYQGKVNRWIVRYLGDRAKPLAYFPIELTELHKAGIAKRGLVLGTGGNSVVLDKPESIMRLSEVIFDALAWCQDDGNFKRERNSKAEVEQG
ncbi:type I restriction endonuclease subunit R [Geobacter sp. FeAm09]|uniref:type I restriction endonuclease n=1 Tax=Geobacter sp. FeAm09 TaxID=2597769 RepID=UPI0011EF35EC|nr:type I restriction endonuclease [Geobacter sp. FeAm09]QEM66899.1 type I restriction endonuclease subunit R [Geobacter sp. FeAm09]